MGKMTVMDIFVTPLAKVLTFIEPWPFGRLIVLNERCETALGEGHFAKYFAQ